MNDIFESTGMPASESAIAEFEALIGARLPEDYRAFLKTINGGHLFRPGAGVSYNDGRMELGDLVWGCFSIKSGEDDINIRRTFETLRDRRVSPVVPIAWCGCGNIVAIGVGEENYGKVFHWDLEEECDENYRYPLLFETFGEFIDGLEIAKD